VAFALLCFFFWNNRQEDHKKLTTNVTEYNLMCCVIVLGVLGSCLTYVGRVILMPCEHDVDDLSSAEKYEILRCNPLEGTG
jgi:hypothetical protein